MPFTFKLSQRLARMRCSAIVLTAAALAACEKPIQVTDPGSAAPQVFVSPRTVTLRTNQMVDMMAVALTPTGDTVALSVTWSVTSGSLTDTTTSGGRHLGRFKAGSDTGKVKVVAAGHPGGASDTSIVTVTAVPVSAVTISPASASVLAGQSVQLAATTLDSAGNVLTGRTVTWTSGNASVASVNGTGLVAGVAAGSTIITAVSEGKSGTASISVANVPVASVTVSPATASLTVGGTQQFTATPKDANGNPLSGRTITWTSGNSNVASVNGTGFVTGVAAGSTILTAVSEGQSGTASIAVANVPVASVTVSPATASLTVGGTQQFTATPKDANGNPLSGRTISWTSSNASVASVNASGLVGAAGAGSATVTATSEGKSGTAAVTVINPVTSPGTVTDLAVSGVTDTSATLSFTQVTDGAGQPASYDVRYAAGTISWGSGTEVSRGSCATPVAGTAIGARRTCTVLGLSGSTAYQMQLVAFRGTLGTGAVFGGVSNVASGTTAAGTPAPVATVAVSPATVSVGIGGTQQFSATLKDASGNVLTGRTVTWTSSALSVATITGSGLVTALLAGTTTIRATSEGKSGTATLTVTALPPPSGSWPNEPAGLTVLSDYSFTDPIPLTQSDVAIPGGSGWMSIYNGNGYVSLVSDPTAPLSTASVLQMKYPTGFAAGSAPGTLYRSLPSPTQLYVGFWWKPSNPWQSQGSSGVNKIAFWWAGSGEMPLVMYGPLGGPYELKFEPEFGNTTWLSPTVHVPVTLGVWHRVESFMDTQAGIVRWWLDGQLIGDQTFALPTGGFSMFQFSPTWGGMNDTKTETDYFWFDHVRISGR